MMSSVLYAFILICFLLVSCGKKTATYIPDERKHTESNKTIGTSEEGKAMSLLLREYDQKSGKEQIGTAECIFERLFKEEITGSRITATTRTPADSLDMLVWYWAGEYFWETQDYDEGLRYACKALPLTYRLGDQLLQGDCEGLAGLFYFRQSDYIHAIEHTRKSLALDRQAGDNSRISSSLNTLAGICLTAKQLDDGEKYILEAIRYSTEAKDSNRMAIQYGMASEIYHAMGKDTRALDYARRACDLDSARGNTAKVGIRLSQMAAAQITLG